MTPDMVRTRDALAMTASYLYGLLDDRPEVPFMLQSKFLWDRLRSVRQTCRAHHRRVRGTVAGTDRAVRDSLGPSCAETTTVTNPDGHNSHLNVEQLAKTLTSLRHMYDDRAARGWARTPGAEAEMFAFQLLLRIDSHGRYNVQKSEMLNDLRSARPAVLQSPDVQLALAANRAYHANNIIEFFRLVRSASYLQACVLHKYFSKMRSRALEVVNATYGKQAMPLAEVARLLHTSAEEAEALAVHHGLTVQTRRRGKHNAAPSPEADSARGKVLMIREAGFIEPADEFPILRSPIVDAKRASTYLAEIVPRQTGKAQVPACRRSGSPFQSRASRRRFRRPRRRRRSQAKQAATEAMEKLRAAVAAKEAEIKRRKQQLAAAQKAEPAKAAAPPREPRRSAVGKSDPPATTTTTSPKPASPLAPASPADARGREPAAQPNPFSLALNKNAVPFSPAGGGRSPARRFGSGGAEPAAERKPPAVSAGFAGFAHPEASAEAPKAVRASALASPTKHLPAPRLREDAAAAEAAKKEQEAAEAEALRAKRGREDAARLERGRASRGGSGGGGEGGARRARARGARGCGKREQEALEREARERSRAKGRAGSAAAALEAARRANKRTRREEPRGSSGLGGFPVATPRPAPGIRAAGGATSRLARTRRRSPGVGGPRSAPRLPQACPAHGGLFARGSLRRASPPRWPRSGPNSMPPGTRRGARPWTSPGSSSTPSRGTRGRLSRARSGTCRTGSS